MVGNGQDVYFFTDHHIDHRVWEVPHNEAALPMKPECSQQGMLQQELHRVLEFGEKRLRKSGASPLPVVLGRFSKVLFRLGMKRIPHRNSALNRARVSGPRSSDTFPLSISA